MRCIGAGLAHRQRAPGFYHRGAEGEPFATRRRQQVGLEFHGENPGCRRHQCEGGDAAGTVETCGDDPGMDEAMLLGEVERIVHREIDLARLQPRNRNAERLHRPLLLERVNRDCAIVRVLRLEARHAVHASAGSRCFSAALRIAGANAVDFRACRSMCTPTNSQVAAISPVSALCISCRKRIDLSRISTSWLLTSTMSPASSSRL